MEISGRAEIRDDRVLPETRWASLLVFVVVVYGLVALWGFPDQTADLWAWTISPDLTPLFMGALYGAAMYFFARLYFSREWHPASPGILAGAILATLLLATTLIHWEKFNHGDAPFVAAVAFYGWMAVYILFPPLLTVLWLRNRRTDPHRPEPQDAIVPERIRLIARVFAGGAFLAAAFFLLWPDSSSRGPPPR